MNRIAALAAGLAVLLVQNRMPAADFDPAAGARFVAPFIDEQTVAVSHISLGDIDSNALLDRIATVGGVPAADLAGPRKMAGEMLEKFKKLGVKNMYLVISLADIPGAGPFAIFDGGDGPNAAAIRDVVGEFNFETAEVIGSAIVGGGKRQIDRVKEVKPSPRPDLATAFAAAPNSAIQFALVPTAEQKRIVEEQVRELPQEIGGGPGTILTKGVQWAVLAADVKPKIRLSLTIKSQDAASAAALGEVVKKALAFIAQAAARDLQLDLTPLVPVLAPRVNGDRLTMGVREDEEAVVKLLAGAAAKMRGAAGRNVSVNNLKQIALALHNYHDAMGQFPPTGNLDKNGKPLLSWRVHILPYIEQEPLYKQFRLDEPWDSEHNKTLIAKMPKLYMSPAQKVGDGKTTYLAPMGKDTIIAPGEKGIRIQEITDGTSNTIMVLESGDEAAVTWTKPDDFDIAAADLLKKLVGHWTKGFNAAFGDGSVRFIGQAIDGKSLTALFTRNGGEVVGDIP